MSLDLTVFCRRALPSLEGGWSSSDWPTPRFAAGVAVFEQPVENMAETLEELPELAEETFVIGIGLNCRYAASQHAMAYAEAIARAGCGVVIDDEGEILCDHRDHTEVLSAADLERAWGDFDRQYAEQQAAERRAARAAWEEEKRRDPEGTRAANNWRDVKPR